MGSLILGLETSCDETAGAVVEDGVRVRSNVIATQHELHRKYAGVVPEIASRAHVERLMPVVEEAVEKAGVGLSDLDAIAVGNRPGLIGSLLVGVGAAKALAWSLDVPIVGVDHVAAHLYAAQLDRDDVLAYPGVGLVVSGGHTSLYRVDGPMEEAGGGGGKNEGRSGGGITVIGKTIDDAVGEAYDKAAVILGLGYPGGPKLDRAAQQGNAKFVRLPRSMLGRDSLDFSFSGLKTALLYAVRGTPDHETREFPRELDALTEQERLDFSASFQAAAIDTLIVKLERALDQMGDARSVIIGGGVSANSLLRKRVVELADERGIEACLPPMGYCLDNAAMIAGLAHHRLQAGAVDDLELAAIATTGVKRGKR